MGCLIISFTFLSPTLLALIISVAIGLDPYKFAAMAIVFNIVFVLIWTIFDDIRKVNNVEEMKKMLKEQEERRKHENEWGSSCTFRKKK